MEVMKVVVGFRFPDELDVECEGKNILSDSRLWV